MNQYLFPMLFEHITGADNMKGMRAYLYCRAAYNDGVSLELQKAELLRYAEQNGLKVAGIAAEYASGRTLDRSALKEVSHAVCDGRVDVVLTKNIARISRDIGQSQMYVSFLAEHDTALCCMQERLMFRGESSGVMMSCGKHN